MGNVANGSKGIAPVSELVADSSGKPRQARRLVGISRRISCTVIYSNKWLIMHIRLIHKNRTQIFCFVHFHSMTCWLRCLIEANWISNLCACKFVALCCDCGKRHHRPWWMGIERNFALSQSTNEWNSVWYKISVSHDSMEKNVRLICLRKWLFDSVALCGRIEKLVLVREKKCWSRVTI